jgi:uncharacterized protein
MVINLAELRQRNRPILVRAEFSDQQLKIQNQIQALARPLQSNLKVSLEGDRVSISGEIDFSLRLTCCRCTNEFQIDVVKSFEAIYLPDPKIDTEGEEIELEYSDLDVGFYRNDQIDLTAVLSEQVIFEVPMKPVCKKDCKGLCSICGSDLNQGDCGCSEEPADPRLAPLAELKKKLVN